MKPVLEAYFDTLKGKNITIVGIGVSNRPLIEKMLDAGLAVTACDRRGREAFGGLIEELEAKGLKAQLGCDYLNCGFAGTALCDPVIAEWIVSRRDWHFASLEMGINMLGMEEREFEQRIDAFTGILADDGRPVFATSIFRTGADSEKHARFRTIVRRYAEPRLHFIDGLDLLENPSFISQDMVHPSLEGISQITERWHTFIRDRLPEELRN